MTKKEKDLLLQDLCGRLLYGVKIELTNSCGYHHENIAKKGDITIDTLRGFNGKYFTINHDNPLDWDWAESEIEVEDIKPYLFPLSSMTKKQEEEFKDLYYRFHESAFIFNERFAYDRYSIKDIGFYPCYLQDWLNKNHFDYRGLIEKGLAKDATGLEIY